MLHVRGLTRLILLMLMGLIMGSPVRALTPKKHVDDGVKSYHEWKDAKIHLSESRIKTLKKISSDPNLKIKSNSEAGLSEELAQEILNLSISRDLTISDYFVGYLTQQSSLNTAVKDVAGRLSQEEVAELMMAYAEHFFQTRPSTALRAAPRADSGQ